MAQGRPFYLNMWHYAVHSPYQPDPRFVGKYDDALGKSMPAFASLIEGMDKSLGDLLTHVNKIDQAENTLIFFASDNGYSMCGYMARGNAPNWPDDPWLKNKGPFTGGKFSVLEGGNRIPFFASWPAKFNPGIVNEPVWLPDFFPTAVELSGMSSEDYLTDGVNLLPALQGNIKDFEGHEFMYFSKGREQAVRMGPWKAYRKSPDSETELYLIEEDTYALRNMAFMYPDIVRRAEEIMKTEHQPHEWYWNPWETNEEYQDKVKKAVETGNKLPSYRPNGMSIMPEGW